MPQLHARYLEPEALREHLREANDAALAKTQDTGALDDDAAAALLKVIRERGEHGGGFEYDDWNNLLDAAGALLGEELAAQLFEGGWLDRHAVGAHAFGSLPLRVLQREVTPARLKELRKQVETVWHSELLNLLESAAMRATRAPEEHLVLLPSPAGSGSREAAPHPSPLPTGEGVSRILSSFLSQLRDAGGSDLTLRVGEPPMIHGHFGARALGDVPLSAHDVAQLATAAGAFTPGLHTGDHATRVLRTDDAFGPSLTIRAMMQHLPTLDALGLSPLIQQPLLKLTRGLVLLSGEPSSGRSTLFSALLEAYARAGRQVASLEEPLTSSPAGVRQHEGDAAQFARSVKLQPFNVIGFDLNDDALALDLALDAAMDGRLAVCVFRAPNVAAAVHRAGVLDARFHRRRISDHLAALSFQRLAVYDGRAALELDFHLPSVALRRHLRAHETPPPPITFENEEPH